MISNVFSMKKLFRSRRAVLVAMLVASSTSAVAQGALTDENLLPHGDFEDPPIHGAREAILPTAWGPYQWGPTGKAFSSDREAGAGRNGSAAIRARNIDSEAYAGAFTKVDLEPGAYEYSVWVRAQTGQTARVRLYLGQAYSRPFTVGETWQQVQFRLTFSQPVPQAEVNLQNASGEANVVWFDDAVLRKVEAVEYVKAPDTRAQRPRTLLFSPINVNYLKDTAPQWAARGFRGFMFDQIMHEWFSDVWAADGDAQTRGEDDKLLQEVLAANKASKAVGIDSNFVKVAFYKDLPDFFDDAQWETVTRNFAEGARFARMSGCAGVAIDTEYIPHQYDPKWEGYAANPRPLPELKAKIAERWHTVVSEMLNEFPDMVLLTLPEGVRLYGELYNDMFAGMLSGMAENNAPGGLHVFTEMTYSNTDPLGLGSFVQDLDTTIVEKIPAKHQDYWKERGSIALGAWPFGYYREIIGQNGQSLGYSGREETFGNQVVGSYADKSARYSPAEFAEQMTGLNTFSPRYNWIYGHGDIFTHMTPEQIAHYKTMVHKSLFNVHVPTAPNMDQYFPSIVSPGFLVRKK